MSDRGIIRPGLAASYNGKKHLFIQLWKDSNNDALSFILHLVLRSFDTLSSSVGYT